jgi:hypothetical protein
MVNILNRVIVTVILVIVIVLLVAVAVTPEGVAAFLAFQLMSIRVAPLSLDHLIVAAVSLLAAGLCSLVLRLQWRRTRPRSIPLVGAGSSELAAESIVSRLKTDVEAVDQVQTVIPTIFGRGKVVDVNLEVRTEPHVDVPAKAEEVDGVIRETISRMGLRLGKTKVKIVVAKASSSPLAPPSS